MRTGIGAITAAMAACLTLSCAQPDCANWNGYDFFRKASAGDVQTCLLAGADPNARNWLDYTPLHLAARSGDARAIAALADGGADPNARNEYGRTPLHHAAWEGHAAAVDALREAGADPDARDENGETPFDRIGKDSPLTGTSAWTRLKDAIRD